MPKKVERKMMAKAKKKFPHNKEKQHAYVYGGMRERGLLNNYKRGK